MRSIFRTVSFASFENYQSDIMLLQRKMCCIAFIILVSILCDISYVKGQNEEEEDIADAPAITLEQVNQAGQEALVTVQAVDSLENELKQRGLVTRRGSPSAYHQSLFRADPQQLAEARWSGLVGTETANSLINNLQMPITSRAREIRKVSLENAVVREACPRPPACNPTRYRSIDGSCNNLENISWGKSFTALQRLLPAAYDDGINLPRRTGGDRGPLPNPRRISTMLSPDIDIPSNRYTSLLMQWGQFLDHDITNTALTSGSDGTGIVCCAEEIRNDPSLLHPACFPIDLPADDPFFSQHNQTCLEFVRSLAAPVEECRLGQRQQLNTITAFIDGSIIYGSTVNQSRNLRSFEGGKLKSSPTHGSSVLPPDPETLCGNQEDEPPCFLAGDNRVNENTLLTVFHQIWFREHNRIAGILARMNAGWNDEVLYQEARRIVGAMIQHITYNEFLPVLLGQRMMAANHLSVQRSSMNYDYDRNMNPTLSNIFATAAYRLGHTLVQGRLPLVSRNNEISDTLSLVSQYFTPAVIYQEEIFDMLVRGLAFTPSQSFDTYFTDQLTNHLFQPPGFDFGLDLVALNIQRGRDHGVPPYSDWREYCNLTRIDDFDELANHMSAHAVGVFRQLYRHVGDIDMYVAGISEISMQRDALLPPVFGCLVAEQFRRLKYGDRFYYENGDMESSFSQRQLDEIRKVTLARVLCDNSNIQSVQRNAFFVSGRRNHVEPCIQGNIPRMSLDPWQNEPVWV